MFSCSIPVYTSEAIGPRVFYKATLFWLIWKHVQYIVTVSCCYIAAKFDFSAFNILPHLASISFGFVFHLATKSLQATKFSSSPLNYAGKFIAYCNEN
jgi:hypothetical protein